MMAIAIGNRNAQFLNSLFFFHYIIAEHPEISSIWDKQQRERLNIIA
jgi:hypothetical protein